MKTAIASLGILPAVLLFAGCNKADGLEDKYERIEVGMTLESVESILGKGRMVEEKLIRHRIEHGELKPAVEGDVFYMWDELRTTGVQVTIGFRDNKVVGKHIFVPSL